MALVKVTAETLAEPMEFEQVLLETTFGVFKEEVATRYGSPASAFRLYFGGQYCKGVETLASKGVVEGASIRLVPNLDKVARGKKRVLVGETKRGKYATLIRQGKDTKEAVDAVARTQQEVLTGQAKAQADLTAIRAAIEPMQPMRIPGEPELMEQVLNTFKVAHMNSLLERWGIAPPRGIKKNGKARLLAQKAPQAELQEALRDSATSGSAKRLDHPASVSVRADRKRMRLLVEAKAVDWTPPTSVAHRQLQRQLAWKARCEEVDGQGGDQEVIG